jgi:putative flippase GtrA
MRLGEVGHVSRFLHVGAVGFAIDAGLLWLLVYSFGLPPIFSRVISFMATIAVTFVLNARYTFAVEVRHASKTRYTLIQVVGAGLNFSIYSLLVTYGPLRDMPLIALVFGSAVASTHNFLLMRRYVFAGSAETTGKPQT